MESLTQSSVRTRVPCLRPTLPRPRSNVQPIGREVASQAFKVQNDQGASYIDGSEAVAAGDSKSGLLESIGKIFKLFAPTGGGGA
jgi:hypothetical protein